jgi:hypothetical protein
MVIRYKAALAILTLLAILAGFTLDGKIRLVTLLLLGAFAVKTVLVELRRRID